jgi:hypothetical protein
MEREDRFSLEEKWKLLPRFASGAPSVSFDESSYPWSHFRELVRLRNDFVHPKNDRQAYYRAFSTRRIESLDWNQFPREMWGSEKRTLFIARTESREIPTQFSQNTWTK